MSQNMVRIVKGHVMKLRTQSFRTDIGTFNLNLKYLHICIRYDLVSKNVKIIDPKIHCFDLQRKQLFEHVLYNKTAKN